MAVHKIVSVKDLAAQAFGRPVFVQSAGVAVRSFSDEVNRDVPDNQMFSHPVDFELYELGEFDDATGSLLSSGPPALLIRGVTVKSAVPSVGSGPVIS